MVFVDTEPSDPIVLCDEACRCGTEIDVERTTVISASNVGLASVGGGAVKQGS